MSVKRKSEALDESLDLGEEPAPKKQKVSDDDDAMEGVESTTPNEAQINEELQRRREYAKRFGLAIKDTAGSAPIRANRTKRYYNEDESKYTMGMDFSSDEAMQKMKARASKYGLDEPKEEALIEIEYSEEMREPRGNETIRAEAIHMFGTSKMSTDDIFKYWGIYRPSFVEWLNDSSCNVVFKESNTVERALNRSTKPTTNPKWRIGEYWRGRQILARKATNRDVKSRGVAGRDSQYYRTLGRRNNNSYGRGRNNATTNQVKPTIIISEEEKRRRDARAKRFGILPSNTATVKVESNTSNDTSDIDGKSEPKVEEPKEVIETSIVKEEVGLGYKDKTIVLDKEADGQEEELDLGEDNEGEDDLDLGE